MLQVNNCKYQRFPSVEHFPSVMNSEKVVDGWTLQKQVCVLWLAEAVSHVQVKTEDFMCYKHMNLNTRTYLTWTDRW